MRLPKKSYFIAALLIAFLTLSFTAVYFYIGHKAFLAQRHHLLCEVLRAGMSKNEVVNVLRQVGDFRIDEIENTSNSFALAIIFTNPDIQKRNGYFLVVFINGKYARAVVPHGSDNPEYVCDFSNAVGSMVDSP
jgi:hypothetical protein